MPENFSIRKDLAVFVIQPVKNINYSDFTL